MPDVVSPRERRDRLLRSTPFKRFRRLQRLSRDRSGHASLEHVRHQLYVGRDTRTRANALVKIMNKPGLVYEHNLTNEIETLSTINGELPDSRYFPSLWDHGRLSDGRVYLIMSLFDEWPLATTIGHERMADRLVAHIRMSLEVATALADLHGIGIFHVDLNPMNILYRAESGRPIVRIVDFESSYELARHGAGAAYNPPTTPRFSAPEIHDRAPDGRADVFSLGAVLYTAIAGYGWTLDAEVFTRVEADGEIDHALKEILLTATSRDAERRYGSAQDMYAALAGYLESIWPGRAWR